MELPDQVTELLEAPNFAHLATLMPDGSPHSVAVWAGLEDGRIAFFTQPASQKALNVEMRQGVLYLIEPDKAAFTELPFERST
jgi:general stress protein 26